MSDVIAGSFESVMHTLLMEIHCWRWRTVGNWLRMRTAGQQHASREKEYSKSFLHRQIS